MHPRIDEQELSLHMVSRHAREGDIWPCLQIRLIPFTCEENEEMLMMMMMKMNKYPIFFLPVKVLFVRLYVAKFRVRLYTKPTLCNLHKVPGLV